jgi:predicted DNA-binding transcriptional regulator AlpA
MRSFTEQTVPQTGTLVNNRACDTRAAAEILGLAEQTLRKLRMTGNGPPFVKLGRAVRYRQADLDAWLSSHLVNSTSGKRSAGQ